MLRRELKVNLKSFCIWSSILIFSFLIVFLIYPSIVNSENVKMLDEMIKIFPEEVIKAFNMDISSIDSAFGWLKSEGFVFVLLTIGCYAGTIGSNILLKEESEKTIEYLNSLPVTRKNIVISKAICGIIYIISIIGLLGLFNFIGLKLIEEFDTKLFLLLSITPIFSSIAIFSLCMFISTFTHKQKKMTGISLGIVFISYILQMLSELGESTEFLKYFSAFSLADIRNVILNSSINPIMVVISIVLTIVFIILTIINYKRKELV